VNPPPSPAGGRVPDLSVVIPLYGCEGSLRELHRRLHDTLSALVSSFELVFVEDGGPDRSWEVLRELAAADPHLRAVRLSRNFGQHAAITAGLAEARGARVVVMDCDLQEPPEDIGRLWESANAGYDVVLSRRRQRRQPWTRRLTSRLYFAFLSLVIGRRVEPGHGTLSLLSRKVVAEFLRFKDRDRHYLFIVQWLGFRSATIEYEPRERPEGGSSYTLRSLLRLAVSGVFAYTTVFLRWIVYLGFAVSAGGLVVAALYLWRYLAYDTVPAGFTALALLVVVMGGFGILTTGVSALYVGKIFEQVKERPLFVVDERVSGPEG
jgi:polyisoprenyl-phosphate glycosyltransferase